MESGKQRLDCSCAVGLGIRAPCFHSLGFPWCPWIFQCFFDVFWSPFGTPFHGFGVRGGTQLIEYKNKALATCTSILCFRSATGPSTCSLVGRPSTRGRIYVAFGEHPAAGGLYMSFWSLWHFARPCGVSLALWVALGLHCGTLGFHFDTPEV